MNTFFIADLHFGHTNIIKYESRPFETVEQMDQHIVDMWNSVVKKEDKVFVLGDVSIYGRETTTRLLQAMKGQKILIMGNHDKGRSVTFWKAVGFHEVIKYPIIYKEFYMLSHEPLYVNEHMPYLNIHGHIHGRKIEGQYFNVGVEVLNFVPISFEQIKQKVGIE